MLGLPGVEDGVWWGKRKTCGEPGCDAALVYPDVSVALDEGLEKWDPVLRPGGQEALALVERSEISGFLLVDLALLRIAQE